jgi:formylglycine-generating enzyme required for sulfatase activity
MLAAEHKLKVFLCHASQDRTVVRELYQKLLAEGWIEPWLDVNNLLPGQDWHAEIEIAVETADIVIIFISNISVNKDGFVQKELRYARDIALEKSEGTIFLIPVRLENANVPRGLRHLQWIDYFGEAKDQSYADLTASLKIRLQDKINKELIAENAQRLAEEKERLAKQARVREEAEEKARRDTEVKLRKEAEEQARKELQDRVDKEDDEKIRREKVERIRNQAEQQARAEHEALEKIRKESTGQVRGESNLPEHKLLEEKSIKGFAGNPRLKAESHTLSREQEWARAAENTRGKITEKRIAGDEKERRPRVTVYTLAMMVVGLVAVSIGLIFVIYTKLDQAGFAINTPSPARSTTVIAPTLDPSDFALTDPNGNKITMRFVPAGAFIMGSNNGYDNEKPAHSVTLPDYYIDKYEVTTALFKACVDAGACPVVWYDSQNNYKDNNQYPVGNMNWFQAKAYCEWRGARLPSEAEWEKAARGTDGRTYPWGEGGNCNDANTSGCMHAIAKVGAFGADKSPYGVYDMSGNLAEWVADIYAAYPGGDSAAVKCYGNAACRVIKGGAFATFFDARAASRSGLNPASYVPVVGIRCARDATP